MCFFDSNNAKSRCFGTKIMKSLWVQKVDHSRILTIFRHPPDGVFAARFQQTFCSTDYPIYIIKHDGKAVNYREELNVLKTEKVSMENLKNYYEFYGRKLELTVALPLFKAT